MISKTINGQVYYYLATSARADGRPAADREQKYLGTAAEIEAAMDGAVRMLEQARHLAFCDLAAA